MRAFITALSLLSIFPVGGFMPSRRDLALSPGWFPAAGMVLAVVVFCAAWLLSRYLPGMPGAALLLLFTEVLIKAYHLDGLADTADGFLSSRPRERKLEIMRDSRTGVMGVTAIFFVLLLKFSLLATIDPLLWPYLVAFAAFSGRCSLLFHIATCPCARPNGSSAIYFEAEHRYSAILWSIFLTAIGVALFGVPGLLFGVVIVIFSVIWRVICLRSIGGATGDTLGAAEEICELLVMYTSLPVLFLVNSTGKLF